MNGFKPSQKTSWQKLIAPYAHPHTWRSVWQVINTLVPYFLLWYLMIRSVEISLWLTVLLALPAAGFMMRTFIIFHDCGHGSFFASKKANTILGILTGILTFTPYHRWRHDHAIHHATAGDLDRRGTGDVYTMTVEEYIASPWWKKFGYRMMRNPLIMFIIGGVFVFAIAQRFPHPGQGRQERLSVWYTNLALVGIIAVMVWLVGWKAYLIVQFLVLLFGTSTGIWLFYVQHNFNGTYWERQEKWDFFKAAVQGSSFYKLPGILNWFSGNIGFHHIHHLSPRIPNYNLPKCYRDNPQFHVKPLTLFASLRSLRLRLWDEQNRCMVGWEILKRRSQNFS